MVTDPKDHPLHQVPDNLPRPPGDLPPSTEQPARPNEPLGPSAPDTAP